MFVISNNSFEGMIPNSYKNWRYITGLTVAYNSLISNPKTNLALPADFIENATQLFAIDLSNNKFTGDLPNFNVSTNKLRYFSIKNNKFTQTNFGQWFAQHIIPLQNIKIAVFDNNPYMSGEFPSNTNINHSHSLLVVACMYI